jgi:hypothetical protein
MLCHYFMWQTKCVMKRFICLPNYFNSGLLMNRVQAVNIYREIVNSSEMARFSAVNLKLSEKNDPVAQDYQIRITMPTDPVVNQQITFIAKKHNLEVKEENGEVVVYELKKFYSAL